MKRFEHIGIVGAGAWGTALATVAARCGKKVTIWAREQEVVEAINLQHENLVFLPGIELPESISAVGNIQELLQCDVLLLVTPAQAMKSVLEPITQGISAGLPMIICSKGFEQKTGLFLSEILDEIVPQAEIGVLSGPCFAGEVAKQFPTAVTLAVSNPELAISLGDAFSHPTFRPYISHDVLGAQVGGAVKNVLAIACGVATGKGYGANARAALTTRGFAELARFALAKEAEQQTIGGLSGLGDLILTCNSEQSRNMSLGVRLGKGESLDQILSERQSVSEGVYTASAVVELAKQSQVEMPICQAVDDIISGRSTVDASIHDLLNRPLKPEGF